MRDVTLNQQEQARIQVLNGVLEYQLPIAQAAEIMGVSERHTKRLLAAYRKHGPAALAHGNRGRRPSQRCPRDGRCGCRGDAGQQRLRRGKPQLTLTELLREREGIDLSRPYGAPDSGQGRQSAVLAAAVPSSTVSGAGACPRRACWCRSTAATTPGLEDRGPKLTLLIAVDDATGTVAQAVFHTTEDTRGYLVLLEGLVRHWGIPLALYSDRHSAFKYNARQKPVPVENHPVRQGDAGAGHPADIRTFSPSQGTG